MKTITRDESPRRLPGALQLTGVALVMMSVSGCAQMSGFASKLDPSRFIASMGKGAAAESDAPETPAPAAEVAATAPEEETLAKPSKPAKTSLYEWKGDGRKVSRIVIDTDKQRAVFYAGEDEIGWSTIASGLPKHPTPTGQFSVIEKVENKRSNLYGKIVKGGKVIHSSARAGRESIPAGARFEGAHMPYFMRLTHDGIGLHAGPIPRPGQPASHGCIRLPNKLAPVLFEHVAHGTEVTIVGRGPNYGDYVQKQRVIAAQRAREAEQRRKAAEQRATQAQTAEHTAATSSTPAHSSSEPLAQQIPRAQTADRTERAAPIVATPAIAEQPPASPIPAAAEPSSQVSTLRAASLVATPAIATAVPMSEITAPASTPLPTARALMSQTPTPEASTASASPPPAQPTASAATQAVASEARPTPSVSPTPEPTQATPPAQVSAPEVPAPAATAQEPHASAPQAETPAVPPAPARAEPAPAKPELPAQAQQPVVPAHQPASPPPAKPETPAAATPAAPATSIQAQQAPSPAKAEGEG